MGFAKIFHPKTFLDTSRSVLLAMLSLVAGAWLTAWLTQLKALDNPSGQVRAVRDFLSWLVGQGWFIALTGLVVGLTIGIWLEVYLARRAARRWWVGLHTLTVKSFSCLVAGVQDSAFESSPRAKAVAAEILSYINSGHMPLALEMPREIEPSLRLQGKGRANMGPQYEPKNLGPEAIVFKRDLERLAPSRGWKLPWPISPPDPPAKAPVVDANLLNALQGTRDG